MSRPYGTETGTVEVNCPRDCGGALSVEIESEWDSTVNYYSVNATGDPVHADCRCWLTKAELAEVVRQAEDGVVDDPESLSGDWRV